MPTDAVLRIATSDPAPDNGPPAATLETRGSAPGGLPAGPVVLDDATLVVRAREGDAAAFEQLALRFQGPIYRLTLRMLANRSDAEDLTQEVFLAAWRRLPELREEEAFTSWLYRTATNRCLNVLRSRRPVIELDQDVAAADTSDEPERAAQTHAAMAALTVALQQLTDEQRACWLLREVHGRSYAEIAAILSTTTTTVRGRIARGRAQLGEAMKPWR
jgi:RNA polymerase sigma-70 factor (ECF subfamily)